MRGGGLPTVLLWSPGAAPRWLQGGGLVAPAPGGQPLTGRGAHSPPAPLHSPGPRPSSGPSPSGLPLPSLLSPRRVVPVGLEGRKGRRVLGVDVWVSG